MLRINVSLIAWHEPVARPCLLAFAGVFDDSDRPGQEHLLPPDLVGHLRRVLRGAGFQPNRYRSSRDSKIVSSPATFQMPVKTMQPEPAIA